MVHHPVPPHFKVRLSTTVDGQPLDLTTRLGKRRLFRHRAWPSPDTACPGWLRVTFWPGWSSTLPSGRVAYVIHETCQDGELDALLDRVQDQYGVHLWVAPIKYPATFPRGNWWWPGVAASTFTLANVRPAWTGVLKAVAA